MFRRHFFEEGHPFCIAGTKGAAIPDVIAPQPGDYSITKQRFSAFFGTDLDIVLRGLGAEDVYVIVCCCILKEPFIERFNTGEDVYGLSLKYLIERAIFHIDDCTDGNPRLRIVVERRNPNQNQALLKYYNGLRVNGTKWITAKRLIDRIKSLSFVGKKDNVIGLQVADLIAYPISRQILNPDRPNPAFQTIAKNIYTYKGARLGLKLIPH